MVAVEVAEGSFDRVLVLRCGFVVLALELGVAHVGGAVFAPVIWGRFPVFCHCKLLVYVPCQGGMELRKFRHPLRCLCLELQSALHKHDLSSKSHFHNVRTSTTPNDMINFFSYAQVVYSLWPRWAMILICTAYYLVCVYSYVLPILRKFIKSHFSSMHQNQQGVKALRLSPRT